MKTYKIPIIYQRCEEFEVEASSLQEAVQKALQEFLSIPDDHYIEDSFEIDGIVEDNYNETYSIEKVFNNE